MTTNLKRTVYSPAHNDIMIHACMIILLPSPHEVLSIASICGDILVHTGGTAVGGDFIRASRVSNLMTIGF